MMKWVSDNTFNIRESHCIFCDDAVPVPSEIEGLTLKVNDYRIEVEVNTDKVKLYGEVIINFCPFCGTQLNNQ